MKKLMESFKNLKGFGKFIVIYSGVLLLILLSFIIYINCLLVKFDNSQPERIVEKQIELIKEAAYKDNLEEVIPISSVTEFLGIDKYPDSYKKCIIENEITYRQDVSGFGAETTNYNLICDGKHIATLELESSNEHTEMIVFTSAEWSLKNSFPVCYEGSFTVPSSINVMVNGDIADGEELGNGFVKYTLKLLADAEVVLTDMFGNSERQPNSVRTNFYGQTFTVPSLYTVECDFEIPQIAIKSENFKEFEYVEKYTVMPKLLTYDIKAIPVENNTYPSITITDNHGNNVYFNFGDKLRITKFSSDSAVPEELLNEANVIDFARKWSLFMTNDLTGGLGSLSKYLLRDSFLYDVAYKWATGVDRTFTSKHRLYNPPFSDEKIYNYVKYSDTCFSCDVHLVKKMRIANGLDVNDELSRKLFFVKYDSTNNGIDDAKWYVADMIGADEISE